MFHGIAGDSSENYIRSFCNRALKQHRWRCVVYNRRGHKRNNDMSIPTKTIGECLEQESPTAAQAESQGQQQGLGMRRNRSDRALHTSKRTWARHGAHTAPPSKPLASSLHFCPIATASS